MNDATSQRLDGRTWWVRVEGRQTGQRFEKLSWTDVGLRRAELEGQLGRFVDDPALLAHVAAAYERRRPDAGPLIAMRIVRRSQQMEDGRPSGQPVDRIMATWERP